MLRIFLIIFASLVFHTSSHAAGALAIDSNQGAQYGFSYGFEQMSGAIDRAVSECGNNCQVVQTFSGGCAAYAADQTSGSSIYGWATGASSAQVQSNALNYCRSYGGKSCIVRAWACE